MKTYTLPIIALTSSLVSSEIIIHNNKLEDALENMGHWLEEEAGSNQFGKLVRDLLDANQRAKLENT